MESKDAKLQSELDGDGSDHDGGAWVIPVAIIGTAFCIAAVAGSMYIMRRGNDENREGTPSASAASLEEEWVPVQEEEESIPRSPNQELEHETVASI